MGAPQPYTLANVAGGLNQGADQTDINDNEMTELANWYPYAARLKRRGGMVRVNSDADYPNGRYFENLTGAFAFKRASTSTWEFVAGGLTSLAVLDGSVFAKVPHVSGSDYVSSATPWQFEAYKDIIYFARSGGGVTLQRYDGSVASDSGIAAPLSGPTLADGGAGGNLSAGDYTGVVTFYNTATGAESNPSPTSAIASVTANHTIDWTNIPTSSNPQVDARRLYRTLADGDGVWYRVTTITDNTSTTYSDNVIQSGLGFQVLTNNGLPPNNVVAMEVWFERMWLLDGRDLWYSEFLLPESYDALQVLSINPDDGHKAVGLLNFGDRLLVGKTNATFFITTIDGFSFRVQTLSKEHGVFSNASMAAAESQAFWFGGDNFYTTDGSQVVALGSVKIRKIIDAIDPADYDMITGSIDETNGWYMATIPSLGIVAVYHYQGEDKGKWTTFYMRQADNTLGCPTWIVNYVDSDDRAVLYCNLQGGDQDSVFEFNSGNTDDGRPIECELTSKYFGFDDAQNEKIIGDIAIEVTPVAENITIEALRDDAVSIDSATINLFSTLRWFRIPLATAGDAGLALALRLTYKGVKPVDILGISFTITDLERRYLVSEAA